MQDSVALMVAEKPSQYPGKKCVPGAKVKIHIHPSFFDPMSEQELAESGTE